MPREYPGKFSNFAVGDVEFDFTHTVEGSQPGYPLHSYGLVGQVTRAPKCLCHAVTGTVSYEAQLVFSPRLSREDTAALAQYWGTYWSLEESDREAPKLDDSQRRYVVQEVRSLVHWRQDNGLRKNSGRFVQRVVEHWELGFNADGSPFDPKVRYIDDHVEFFDCEYACEFSVHVYTYLCCAADVRGRYPGAKTTERPPAQAPDIEAEMRGRPASANTYKVWRNYIEPGATVPDGWENSPVMRSPALDGVAFRPLGRGSAYDYKFDVSHCPCLSRDQHVYGIPEGTPGSGHDGPLGN